MPVLHAPESEYVKERSKWESIPTMECPVARRPYEFKPYPAMFYKASRPPQGGQPLFEEHIVESDNEAANMRSRGWGSGQAEALAMLEASEQQIATAAAERAFADRKMSSKAQAEAAAADDATAEHLPMIPETPIKRRGGRPKKVTEQ